MKRLSFNLTICVMIILCGCLPQPDPADLSDVPTDNIGFILTSDYSTGSFAVIDLSTLTVYPNLANGVVHSDAEASYNNGIFYIANSLGRDNLVAVDRYNNYKIIKELSLKKTATHLPNPHDIAVISPTCGAITIYNNSYLQLFNPQDYTLTNELDLSSYALPGTNGKLRADQLYYQAAKNRLLVSVQRLGNDWRPFDYSLLLEIDTTSMQVTNSLKLEASGKYRTNPYSQFIKITAAQWQPAIADGHDHLMISTVGDMGNFIAYDGGIVAIDIDDTTLHCESDLVLSEENIQQEIISFIIMDSTHGYAITSNNAGSIYTYRLIEFNPTSGTITAVLYSDSDNNGGLAGIASDKYGRIYTGSRNALNSGLLVYDTYKKQFLNNGEPLDTGLPPLQIVIPE